MSKKDEDATLPDFGLETNSSWTARLPAFHQADGSVRGGELGKELEKLGIGRPSTYASIISTIQDRGYVRWTPRRFYAEKIGELVTDRLMENFDNLMDYRFTANMEEELDKVAHGQASGMRFERILWRLQRQADHGQGR